MHWTSGQVYGQDLRDRVMAAVDSGEPVRSVAERFGVSISYIYKALIRRRRTGEVCVRSERGRPPRKLASYEDAVAAFMSANADATLKDLVRHLADVHGVSVSIHAAWSTVHRLGLTHKKALRAAEQDRSTLSGTKVCRTLPVHANAGESGNASLILMPSSSWTKPVPTRR